MAAAGGLLFCASAFADTTNYYWKDGQGNGRWDWSTNQWFIDGGGNVGVPRSDGGAILFFQGNGTTNTFINSGFTSGYFNLNSIILDSGSSGRNYTISVENGGTGLQFFNKIETQAGGGSLTVNSVTQLGADAVVNAFGGTITLGQVQTNGKTLTVDGGSNTSFGDVINGPGTGSVQKNGTGTLTFGGSSDNLNVAATVNGGTLILNKTSSSSVHAVGAGLTVNSGGTVSLGGSGGDQIFNSMAVTMNGGTFRPNGHSEGTGSTSLNGLVLSGSSSNGIGALTLQSNSTLDFGAAGVGTLTFASFSRTAGTLNILNYTNTTESVALQRSGIDGTDDRLIFNQDQASNLAFFSFNGISATEIALGGGFFEIVPIPEASTWVSATLSLVALTAFSQRRRVLARRKKL